MVQWIDIEKIKPADYNPRVITDEQIKELQDSIKNIGLVVPIIVNKENMVIVAGHQRTKACKAVGIKSVPVIFAKNILVSDEIKLNQIHNAAERTEKLKTVLTGQYEAEEFIEIPFNDFKCGSVGAQYVNEICKIVTRYGNILSCVVCKGEVLLGENYVRACQLLRIPVNSYVCTDNKYALVKKYFGQTYGEYSYNGIKRKTYVQGLAQLYRNTDKNSVKKRQASMLYEKCVMPYLQGRKVSILDFGCGKGDYIKSLSHKYDCIALEFFNNNRTTIDVTKGNKMIDNLIRHVSNKGLFDVVVCDSVLNSVDSTLAEISVIRCLNAFLKNGGKLFISGRPIETALNKYNAKRVRGTGKRFLEFLDKDNFSANLREGTWYFQHWNTKQQITTLLAENGFFIDAVHWMKYGDSFQIECTKTHEITELQRNEAIDFEFNLPLPNGKSYNRNDEVKQCVSINYS